MKLIKIAGGLLVTMLIAGVIIAAATIPDGTTSLTGGVLGEAGAGLLVPELVRAQEACGSGVLADDDTTLIMDMEGDDLSSGDASYVDVICVLAELGTPSYVVSQMESTRALDGMQSASWEIYTAQWTYHPDQGLDITIHQEA